MAPIFIVPRWRPIPFTGARANSLTGRGLASPSLISSGHAREAGCEYPKWEKNFQRPNARWPSYFQALEPDLTPAGTTGFVALPVPEPAAVPRSTIGCAF